MFARIPKPEFPRPEKQRESWKNLNGQWEFKLFPTGEEAAEKAFRENRGDYDRRITVPFSWVCPLSGVEENVAGVGWYRRTTVHPKKERLFLCIGAADYLTDVFVNGAHVGTHQGGYTCFEFEVTDLWRDGENTIEVRCEDYRRETQLYGKQGYGDIQGIWQTVWLEDRPQAFIRDWQVETKLTGDVTFRVQADAPDGAIVDAQFAGQSCKAELQAGEAVIRLRVLDPKLWSPDSPYLYEGAISLGTDVVHTYFGIREIGTVKAEDQEYRRISLNGKPIYLNGTLDQAFNPKGHFTYPTDQDMRDEAWRLKRLGLNMVRIHIKPEEPRKLYWMDKLGILVMEDIPCFWGKPNEEARAAYEAEMPDIIARDINHPSTFAWVVFNESWGLLHGEPGSKVYLPETQEWVRRMYHKAKALDPTRLVEDNSPCRYDHVETDLNTWHFYLNGFEILRDHVRKVVHSTYPGSEYNFIGGNKQTDAPLMNSECGMVWGVEGSAGDSDLAWQYHYMLNEFRLYDRMCGFVFTEFHDVVNEFNGYYRIDDADKDFGYQDFCRGMTLRDMHSPDFIATACAPMQTVEAGGWAEVPLMISSYTDAHHGEQCTLDWELWHDGLTGRVVDSRGTLRLREFGWGTTPVFAPLEVQMPMENAAAVLSLYMKAADGTILSRNFTTFDVRAALPENQIEIPVCDGRTEGFEPVWTAVDGNKLCMGGSGAVTYEVRLPEWKDISELNLYLEAGSKRILKKDLKEIGADQADLGFMRGYRVDRGAFANSYWMTDESRLPTDVEVVVDGTLVETIHMDNDWADARGMLSWHSQPNPRKLDEAGSYGEEKRIALPSRLIPGIEQKGGFTLTLRVRGGNGLALYGRHSGRYPHGLLVEKK